ncbi:GNAT family N-acetyltransferase [Cutibacterium sp. WCA-380-WT-3A]|uniref:GNAT family N-acetyltransferase n=1 Tax=Cutibacterium porci TaxID=2605781 RepID=A0A7K0J610_9ACTN|nr:GNAT family N-acetyltransferase [Cutibacterium porci]MSS45353.1 GNAT family N-acetyltransferase [Cutibacterium porci]
MEWHVEEKRATQGLADEWQGIAHLFTRSVTHTAPTFYDPIQVQAWLSCAPITSDQWRNRLRGQVLFLARQGHGHVAGFASLAHDGEIDMLFVDPNSQRKGVATLLLTHVIATAKRRGLSRLTTFASVAAHEFFTRRGFTTRCECHPQRGDITLTNYFMELQIERQ